MAAPIATEATPNLLHVQFKNPEFLTYLTHLATTQPSHTTPSSTSISPLNEYNVMSYFATSPFFDRRSNNEQIRMQNIANGLAGGMAASQEEQELKRFTGLEFVLVHAKDSCFVIQKRWRTSPTETTPLAAYYIVNDSIYQAPDLYSILATRLQSTVYGLKSSLTTQRRARPNFDPRRGHHGRFIVPDPPKDDQRKPTHADNDDDEQQQEADEQGAQPIHGDGQDDDIEFEQVDASPSTPAAPHTKRARFD